MFDFDDLILKIPLILSILMIMSNLNFMLSFVISGRVSATSKMIQPILRGGEYVSKQKHIFN